MNYAMNKQSGMALFVSLIFLLLLTIIGIAAMQGAGMQEKMAGNTKLKNESFQYAEAALREGEAIVASDGAASCTACVGDACRGPNTSSIVISQGTCNVWKATTYSGTFFYTQKLGESSRVVTQSGASAGSATLYRITAVSDVGNARTVLESVYAK